MVPILADNILANNYDKSKKAEDVFDFADH